MSAPLSARVDLGKLLRRSRERAQLKGADVAAGLGTSESRVSRIETGRTRITLDEVHAWLRLAGVPDDRHGEAIELLDRADTQVSAFRELNRKGFGANQKRYGSLAERAIEIIYYQTSLVPALMQTASYCRYVLEKVLLMKEDDWDEAVQSRMARKAVLYRPGTKVRAVVTEALLHHRLGGPHVYVEQLRALADFARLPSVDLRIIPLSNDVPMIYSPPFTYYRMPDPEESVAFTELPHRQHDEKNSEALAEYERRFELTWSWPSVLRGQDAIALIEQVADEQTAALFATDKGVEGE